MAGRTVILSDLHLGNGGAYDIFAGADVLPGLIDELSASLIIFNGDTFDFLLNEDPLELEVSRAVEQALAIARAPETRAVLRSLGRQLARGGEALIRLGNHDAELGLAEVQAVFRDALEQPDEIAARLRFERGSQPHLLDVGGARILVAHGEQNDPWNQIDYETLPASRAAADAATDRFSYPPGSRLVKTLLNPLKRRFGMRFVDLLKPDFQGAVLAALAVNPSAVGVVFQRSTAVLIWQLLRRVVSGDTTFAPEEAIDLGLAARVDDAGLTDEERDQLAQTLGEEPAISFGAEPTVLGRIGLKLGRAGLRIYASVHRAVAGAAGERYFSLEPGDEEWGEAQRLGDKFAADAVVVGHTHAARFRATPRLTYVNTGTWIWLMQLPPADAGDDDWTRFLEGLREAPAIEGVPIRRLVAAIAEPAPRGGARLSLVEWQDGRLVTLGERDVGGGA